MRGPAGARWLILCDPADEAAAWAHQGLVARGLPADLVTSDDLAGAGRWRHRVGTASASIEVVLADGRVVDGATVAGTLNRLVAAPLWQLAGAGLADRDYAGQEVFAFFLSWLRCLPGPVLNRPTPQGLSGAWRHDSEWAVLAARSGLRTPPYRMDSGGPRGAWSLPEEVLREDLVTSVLVVSGEVVGSPGPAEVAEGCRRLAEVSGTELLGVDLVEDHPGSWSFLQASPQPELRLGGEPFLDVLAGALANGRTG